MNIVYLHQYFNTPDMSGGTRSYEFGRRLVAAGHSVSMITSWRQPSSTQDWRVTTDGGMQVHWLPVAYSNHMSYGARIRAFLRFAFAAARRAARLDADVVFASSTPLTIALPAVYAARRQKVPMIFEVRDLWPAVPIALGALKNPLTRSLARRLERFAYRNAAHVIALSPGMAQGVAATGYLTSDISVIPNSADLDEFDVARPAGQSWREQLKVRDDQILVGYVGTLGRVNNVTQLVEIAGELADDARFRFVIVGDGIERELVTRLARERGVLGRSLHLLDAAPKSAMPAILAALDVATSFVLPIREMEMNSANKFFDALAAGRCVAINHGGWQADLLETFNAGIQMPYDSAPAAAALRALADQPGLIQRKGHNARKLAADQFSRDALANQLEQVLVNVVQATALHSDEPG